MGPATLCRAIAALSRAVYVSLSGDDRILRLKLDLDEGSLHPDASYTVAGGPGPMAFSPREQMLYVSCRRDTRVNTLRIDSAGDLSLAGELTTSSGACYVATDRTGYYLLLAYYADGKITVHRIGDNGIACGPLVCQLDTGVGAHGCGPRHCFHPRLPVLYVANEQGCSVSVYRINSSTGTLTRWHTVSTLPSGFDGENSCSQIRITPDGNNLFAPNRGHDSIANFMLNPMNGALSLIEIVPTETVPRACQLAPDGSLLLVAGIASGRIAVYRIEWEDRTLKALGMAEVGEMPMWILFRKGGIS